MTPVAKTGLHCGTRATTVAKTLDDTVTPVAKTGLHCGNHGHDVLGDQVLG